VKTITSATSGVRLVVRFGLHLGATLVMQAPIFLRGN
jgi:hypothetical protein